MRPDDGPFLSISTILLSEIMLVDLTREVNQQKSHNRQTQTRVQRAYTYFSLFWISSSQPYTIANQIVVACVWYRITEYPTVESPLCV